MLKMFPDGVYLLAQTMFSNKLLAENMCMNNVIVSSYPFKYDGLLLAIVVKIIYFHFISRNNRQIGLE